MIGHRTLRWIRLLVVASMLVMHVSSLSDINTANDFSSKLEEYARNIMGVDAMQVRVFLFMMNHLILIKAINESLNII